MTTPDKPIIERTELRRQAEEAALHQAVDTSPALSQEETASLLHELKVHQIELQMQNEELCSSQDRLEAVKARYFDLYDLAPFSYLTISDRGLLTEANLTAATQLGVPRTRFAGMLFSKFIHPADNDIYYFLRKQLWESGEPQEADLRMLKADGTPFWAHLRAVLATDELGIRVCHLVFSRHHQEEV